MRTVADIEKDIDRICAIGRARMDAADPSIRGLRPAKTDWMEPDELDALGHLQTEWTLAQPTLAEIRERVRQKRAARLAAVNNGRREV